MKKILKKSLIILAMQLSAFSLFAASEDILPDSSSESVSETGNNAPEQKNYPVIKDINFTGLKKTKKSYIMSHVSKFISQPADEQNLHNLETALQLEGLFDDIQISVATPDQAESVIEVSLKEKITFIPLPFAMYSSSGFMAGGIILDTNASGCKNMFLLGGFYSPSSITGMASYSVPPKENFIPGFSVFVSAAKNKPEFLNTDDEKVLELKNTSFSASLSLSEKFGDHHQVSIGTSYKYLNSKNDSVPSLQSVKGSLGTSFSKADWNGVFMSDISASVSASLGITNSDSDDYKHPFEFSTGAKFQKPVIQTLRFSSVYSGYFSKNTHISSWQGPGSAAVTILPGNFKSRNLFGGNAGFEWAFHKSRHGQFSLYSNYEAAYVQDFDEDYVFVHGATGGMKVYLSKIAFPALSMGLSYNAAKNYWLFAAAMGISM